MLDFGERLKIVRKSKELTQKQAAKGLKIAERSYQRYEGNESTPSFDGFIALVDFFDVSADYLIGRSDDPERKKQEISHA